MDPASFASVFEAGRLFKFVAQTIIQRPKF